MALDALRRIEPDTVELPGDAVPSEAERAIEGADRVVIRFPTFKDGRGFSLAALLRRSGYDGELRATGPLLPDQIDDLLRMGFDAVDIERPDGPARNRNTGGAPYIYQPDPGAVTARPTALHLRALAARNARACRAACASRWHPVN